MLCPSFWVNEQTNKRLLKSPLLKIVTIKLQMLKILTSGIDEYVLQVRLGYEHVRQVRLGLKKPINIDHLYGKKLLFWVRIAKKFDHLTIILTNGRTVSNNGNFPASCFFDQLYFEQLTPSLCKDLTHMWCLNWTFLIKRYSPAVCQHLQLTNVNSDFYCECRSFEHKKLKKLFCSWRQLQENFIFWDYK
jgi:hypothetical protein